MASERDCTHLDQISAVTPSADGCEDCLRIGSEWVHLRMCLICGHAGCCDSSPNRHASAHATTCTCTACLRASSLDLKFVLHAGRFVLQQIAGSRELSGPDVVMAHRLLKNSAADKVGHGAYALLSAAAVSQLDIPVDHAISMTETYDHYSPISAFVFALR
jgi:hypothetical protein